MNEPTPEPQPTSDRALLGPELGPLVDALSDELSWVFIRWSQYTKLFTADARVEILNAAAPFFFWVVQETLWYDTLLGISRLAGPPKTAGKDNLSIHRVVPLIQDESLSEVVRERIDRLSLACDFAIQWRNRHIAHRDLALALKREARPLPKASEAQVSAALEALASALNAIDKHFRRTTVAYHAASTVWDADSVVYCLRDGLRREEIRQRRLEEGQYDPADWNDDLPAV